ncbi:hypothetical protein [Terricaulis sp.]|uniref:hypothetical protein n=1 Tax=Terricaulis sp. TaxID=2768686 RepID=UPI00378528E4
MASESLTEAHAASLQARLTAAVDAIEANLDALAPGANPDDVAAALAEPIKEFDAAAREAAPR